MPVKVSPKLLISGWLFADSFYLNSKKLILISVQSNAWNYVLVKLEAKACLGLIHLLIKETDHQIKTENIVRFQGKKRFQSRRVAIKEGFNFQKGLNLQQSVIA